MWYIFFYFDYNSETDVQPKKMVYTFGKKKKATAVAICKQGNGLIKVNGRPIDLVQPELLRYKIYEPILTLGKDK